MRSIFIYLWQTTESTVATALDAAYSRAPRADLEWIQSINEDPYLYISFYHDGPAETGDWDTRFAAHGGPPTVSVVVDISGRHEGWPQTRDFAVWALSRFNGIAEDDNAERFWSREEIEEDRVIDGRKFGSWRNQPSA